MMACHSLLGFLPFLFMVSSIAFPSLVLGTNSSFPFPLKAVNLGGWLVIEEWLTPDLFDGISNKDLLDGTQVQFQSPGSQKYLSAENGGGSEIVANRRKALYWESFKLWRVNESTFQFRVFGGQFISSSSDGTVIATTNDTSQPETKFVMVRNNERPDLVRIRASNGLFLQAKTEQVVTADLSEDTTTWGNDDPSVFLMNVILDTAIGGEFQLTNGLADKAAQVLTQHWNSFIVEEDFEYVARHKLNAVRIPVGWWIASDPDPPKPFVGGSLQALDNAFAWAEKYNLVVILDLHAVPGSQNGKGHTASRDGTIEWGKTDENIQQTVDVIDFLASRYADRPSLVGVEVMNEPLAPGVSLESLKKYYRASYDAVRRHTDDAYVIMSNRHAAESRELIDFASGFQGAVVDFHYYNLYYPEFAGMTPQQNIDFIWNKRSADLSSVTLPNGPLILIGEWSAVWEVEGKVAEEDIRRYVEAQLEVYGKATFGWAWWTLKTSSNSSRVWDLKWMMDNGYFPPQRMVDINGYFPL